MSAFLEYMKGGLNVSECYILERACFPQCLNCGVIRKRSQNFNYDFFAHGHGNDYGTARRSVSDPPMGHPPMVVSLCWLV